MLACDRFVLKLLAVIFAAVCWYSAVHPRPAHVIKAEARTHILDLYEQTR